MCGIKLLLLLLSLLLLGWYSLTFFQKSQHRKDFFFKTINSWASHLSVRKFLWMLFVVVIHYWHYVIFN